MIDDISVLSFFVKF